MKTKWRNGVQGIKVYWGDKYDFSYEKKTRTLLYSPVTRDFMKTKQVSFQEANQIVESLER